MASNDECKKPVRVTRDDLYRRVWETPMSRLAVQYGISGNGLAKICKRLQVPYPPRGHWAKKAAGKKTIRYELPAPNDDTPLEVIISATPPQPKLPKLAPEIQEKAETARAQAEKMLVSKRLTKPHPIIARWLADHERRKQEARRERDPWIKCMGMPKEFSPTERRQHRILNALFKEIERQGGRIKEGDQRQLYAEVHGEAIAFQIREKQKQVRRPLTEDERRWHTRTDRDWKPELQPTGKLVFVIKTWLRSNGLQTEWLEKDATPMEMLLPDIVATFAAAGPLLAEQRRQRDEVERQQRIAESKRYEEQKLVKLDENRWRRFVEVAHQWNDAEIARAFIAQVKRLNYDEDEYVAGNPLGAWLAWAEEHTCSADPLNHGLGGIFGSVGEVTAWSFETHRTG